jgi:NAD(P)H dehydrogenase (quinone)
VYELGGDEAFTLAELAAAISVAAGQRVTYADLPVSELAQELADAGLPADAAEAVADADRGMSRGELFTTSGDLRRLIGRPATSLANAITAALR